MVQVKLKRFKGLKLTGASPVLHSRFSHSAAKSLLVGGVQRVMDTHGLMFNAVPVALPSTPLR